MTDLPLPIDIRNDQGELVGRIEQGAAEGSQYLTLRLYRGDFLNVRNVQGGTVDDPNLDLGAGGDGGEGNDPRGNVVVNWDVGNGFLVYDGRPRTGRKAAFSVNKGNDRQIHARMPVRLHSGLWVPGGDGGWRKARL